MLSVDRLLGLELSQHRTVDSDRGDDNGTGICEFGACFTAPQ
jgi:hypothetical protein